MLDGAVKKRTFKHAKQTYFQDLAAIWAFRVQVFCFQAAAMPMKLPGEEFNRYKCFWNTERNIFKLQISTGWQSKPLTSFKLPSKLTRNNTHHKELRTISTRTCFYISFWAHPSKTLTLISLLVFKATLNILKSDCNFSVSCSKTSSVTRKQVKYLTAG